jgi:hypothetical protein
MTRLFSKRPTTVTGQNGRALLNLKLYWNRWEDPGDYPSGAGAGPLPPGPWFVEDITGTVTYRISPEERWDLIEFESISEWANDARIVDDIPYLKDYRLEFVSASGDLLTFHVVEWETAEDY